MLETGSARETVAPAAKMVFAFRPWVRRAGLSIVVASAAITAAIIVTLIVLPGARYGWVGEPFVWAYIGTLWAGGLRVWLGTKRPVAEIREEHLVLRPLHQFRARSLAWSTILGTEQMTGGDRMIVYYETDRGMRFVAMNLNLVRGRRDFVTELDARLRAMGFEEKIVERSRYLSRVAAA